MQKLKKIKIYFIAPIVVLGILELVFNLYNLYPFGAKTLIWGDMAQQNLPLLLDFKDVLEGVKPPFFSMGNAGGMDFPGIFLFLASSPFSLLTIFVNKADMAYFVNIMILLKIMTCSVTATIFFKKFFKNLNAMQITTLSVCYAFCGYSMMFYQLHTWLDVMYMFPLFLVASHKLFKEDKIIPYTTTLSLMILFQFYLGYMLALFIIFGFAIYIIFVAEENVKKKNVTIFSLGTIISALITAPVWICALNQYENSARGVDLITSLSSGKLFSLLDITLPFILATSLIIVMIPFLFKCRPFLDKRISALILVFILMIIPIIIEPINKMWHTGSYQAFPVRYGYITVLIGLSLVAFVISKLNENAKGTTENKKSSVFLGMVLIIEFIFFVKLTLTCKSEILKSYATHLSGGKVFLREIIIYSLVSCLLLSIVFSLYKRHRLNKYTFSIFLCCLVIIGSIFNCSVYVGFGARSVTAYQNVMSLENKISDNNLYRVKSRNKYFDVNLVGSLGYNSLSHYTSLINKDYIFAMKKLGYSSYWMEVNSNGSTAFVDALLGNKYTISNFYNLNKYDNIIYSNGVYLIVQNATNMSLGNVISKSQAEDLKIIEDKDRIDFQEKLYEILTNSTNPIVTKYDNFRTQDVNISKTAENFFYNLATPKCGYIDYSINVEGRQNLYLDCFRDISTKLSEPINNSFKVRVNGLTVKTSYPSKYSNGILDLGIFEDETVNVSLCVQKNSYAGSFGIFGINLNEMEQGINSIQPASVSINGDVISVDATAKDDDQILMLTIPHSDGFAVLVNGEKVKAEKILDTFMAIPLVKGQNSVTLTYTPCGMNYAIVIFLIGLILLIIFSVLLKNRKYHKIAWLENALYFSFLSLAEIVFVLIYIFPLIVFIIK